MKKILISLPIILLLAAGCNPQQRTNNKTLSNKNPDRTANEQAQLTPQNSFQYGNAVVFYEPIGSSYRVYLLKDDQKSILIDKVQGDTYPTFGKTSNPAVALLSSTIGDMNFIVKESFYIDVQNAKVLSIESGDYSIPTLKIGKDGIKKTIQPIIVGACDAQIQTEAAVSGIKIENEMAFSFNNNQAIKCLSGKSGPFYTSPVLNINVVGVNKELSKIYFTFQGLEDYQTNTPKTLWSYNLSYDVNTGIVKKEQPSNPL